MSEELTAEAVIAQLVTTDARPYELDELKKLKRLPDYYTEVTLTRRFGGVQRSTSEYGTTSYRLATRAVALKVGNAREVRRRQTAALEYAVLTVAGRKSTPIQFESAETIGEDDDWYSGLTLWTFTI